MLKSPVFGATTQKRWEIHWFFCLKEAEGKALPETETTDFLWTSFCLVWLRSNYIVGTILKNIDKNNNIQLYCLLYCSLYCLLYCLCGITAVYWPGVGLPCCPLPVCASAKIEAKADIFEQPGIQHARVPEWQSQAKRESVCLLTAQGNNRAYWLHKGITGPIQ